MCALLCMFECNDCVMVVDVFCLGHCVVICVNCVGVLLLFYDAD